MPETTVTLNASATRPQLIAYLKAVDAYTGHSRDGLEALREHVANTITLDLALIAAGQPSARLTALADPAADELRRALVDSYPPVVAQREVAVDASDRHADVPNPATDPAWSAGPAAATDRAERLGLARAEHQALQAWVRNGKDGARPATPNLDAINDDYAAGGPKATAKVRKARAANPRRAEANAAKARLNGRRGPGRRLTSAELHVHIAGVLSAHTDATVTDELEHAYWVECIAVSRKTWYAAWAAVTAGEAAPAPEPPATQEGEPTAS